MEKRKKEKKEKGNKKKEEISEIFEIENGEEKTIKTHKIIEKEEEKPSKEQMKKEKKIFRNVIIILIGFVFIFFIGYEVIYFSNHFKIDGIEFEVDKTIMTGITLYRTSIPGVINKSGTFVMGNYRSGNGVFYLGDPVGEKAEYNFYFRKDPRQLKKIQFDGGIIDIKRFNVINLTTNFNCNGDGVIAIANLLQLYEVMGGSIIKDENASCDSDGAYGWIQIQEGDETSLERFGPACFNLYVDDCEILDVTEKFMLEILIKLKKNEII